MPQRRKNSMILDPTTKRFTEVDPPEKQVVVELTEEDKIRVVKEFEEIMGRLPDED